MRESEISESAWLSKNLKSEISHLRIPDLIISISALSGIWDLRIWNLIIRIWDLRYPISNPSIWYLIISISDLRSQNLTSQILGFHFKNQRAQNLRVGFRPHNLRSQYLRPHFQNLRYQISDSRIWNPRSSASDLRSQNLTSQNLRYYFQNIRSDISNLKSQNLRSQNLSIRFRIQYSEISEYDISFSKYEIWYLRAQPPESENVVPYLGSQGLRCQILRYHYRSFKSEIWDLTSQAREFEITESLSQISDPTMWDLRIWNIILRIWDLRFHISDPTISNIRISFSNLRSDNLIYQNLRYNFQNLRCEISDLRSQNLRSQNIDIRYQIPQSEISDSTSKFQFSISGTPTKAPRTPTGHRQDTDQKARTPTGHRQDTDRTPTFRSVSCRCPAFWGRCPVGVLSVSCRCPGCLCHSKNAFVRILFLKLEIGNRKSGFGHGIRDLRFWDLIYDIKFLRS